MSPELVSSEDYDDKVGLPEPNTFLLMQSYHQLYLIIDRCVEPGDDFSTRYHGDETIR